MTIEHYPNSCKEPPIMLFLTGLVLLLPVFYLGMIRSEESIKISERIYLKEYLIQTDNTITLNDSQKINKYTDLYKIYSNYQTGNAIMKIYHKDYIEEIYLHPKKWQLLKSKKYYVTTDILNGDIIFGIAIDRLNGAIN